MFGTLTYEETKKRFKKNLRIEKESIGEIEFLKIVCYKKISEKKLEKKLKNQIDTIILSSNINKMQFKNISVYNNEIYLKTIAFYTFKNIIRLSGIPSNRLSVCVEDKNGMFADYVYLLANVSSIVKVVTENKEIYNELSSRIYDDFGMELIMSEHVEEANLGLNLNNETPTIWFNDTANFAQITPKCISLGAGLKSYVPKGINQCDFAGVLQNYKEFKRLKLLNADVMIKNGQFYKINRVNVKYFLDIKDNS